MQLRLRNNKKRCRRFNVIQDYQIKPYTLPHTLLFFKLYSLVVCWSLDFEFGLRLRLGLELGLQFGLSLRLGLGLR